MSRARIDSFREAYHGLEYVWGDYEFVHDNWRWPSRDDAPAAVAETLSREVAPAFTVFMRRLEPLQRITPRIDRESTEWEIDRTLELYALSRFADLILLLVQGAEAPPTFGRLTPADFGAFFEALGFTRIEDRPYTPFHHEVVEVVEEPRWEPRRVEILHTFWPGFMWGDMLFLRSGVRVACSPDTMRKPIAEKSTLHFAHRRLGRPTYDLSVGWGHNSQWKTGFYRSYQHPDFFHFNVDGELNIESAHSLAVSVARQRVPRDHNDSLPLHARQEHLVNRCLIRFQYEGDDRALHPYSDTLSLPRDTFDF